MSVLDSPGIHLDDEILQSGDPEAHADGIAATMMREQVGWVAVNCARRENVDAVRWLREACARRGWGAVGTWAQGMAAPVEVERAVGWGSVFHLANVENPAEDAEWTNSDLDRLCAAMTDGVGVIFTEGAWGRDRAKSRRWLDRGFAALPEAIQSENPQATIPAMLELAAALGWDGSHTAPVLYLTRGYPAGQYTGGIELTGGRWSLWRYGDIDGSDWEIIRTWPRPSTPPPPVPPPPAGISVEEGHTRNIDTERLVNERLESIGQPPLGPTAVLAIAARLSRVRQNLSLDDRRQLVKLLDDLEV